MFRFLLKKMKTHLSLLLLSILLLNIENSLSLSITKNRKSEINFSSSTPTFIKIYYEPFCSASMKFFRNSLDEFYKHRNEFINNKIFSGIQFYPGALSDYKVLPDGTEILDCMRKERGCQANKMHACAINILSEDKSKDFIFCFMQNFNSMEREYDRTGRHCAKQIKIDYTILENCMATDGKRFLIDILKEKEKLPKKVNEAPCVLFNEQFNKESQEKVEWNMTSFACEAFKLGKLEVCKNLDEFKI